MCAFVFNFSYVYNEFCNDTNTDLVLWVIQFLWSFASSRARKTNKHYLNNEGNIQILICLSVLTHAAPSYAFPHGKNIYLDKDPHLLVIMERQWKMSFS